MIHEAVAAEVRRLAQHPIMDYTAYTERKIRTRPQWYGFRVGATFPVAVGAGASQNVMIKIDSDRDFDAMKIQINSIGVFEVHELRFDGVHVSPDLLTSAVLASANPAGLPMILPESLLMRASTEMTCRFVDTSGAANTIYFYLFGVSYFKRMP